MGAKLANATASVSGVTPVAGAGNEPYTRRISVSTFATIAVVAGVLHFGKDVFLPLAIAVLIAFALSPLVSALRNRGLPMIASVLTVVSVAFAVIGLFMMTVVGQLSQLAQDLPTFQSNIVSKLETLQSSGGENGVVARLSRMLESINSEISGFGGDRAAAPDAARTAAPPMPVEVVERQTAVQVLQNLVLPLISPVATAGLVIVVVIFMLLERNDLRDRFIRLVGSKDIHRTTLVLEDAGGRVGNYLLIQLLVNTIYAVPIGVGLWVLGVPNAALWGLLTLVLRFVPYIGSVLAAAFPLFLAFAVSPDWSALLWTTALFASVELVTSNVIEPWLYGSRTGVSPLAIIIAAIFWTWIWGPMGLVLSTPLTVCLVVLGRHVPQFEIFDILFGDEPVLAPHSRLYQRLLAGDAVETTFRAEEELEETYLSEYYRDVGVPALLLAQNDYARGVLSRQEEDRLAEAAMQMVEDLRGIVAEELDAGRKAAVEQDEKDNAAGRTEPTEETVISNDTLDGLGRDIVVTGGRTRLDDVSAAMLAQTMTADGATVTHLSHVELARSRLSQVPLDKAQCLILCFLDSGPSRASLLHVRRIKRSAPHLRVGVVIWQMPDDLPGDAPGEVVLPVAQSVLSAALELGADFAVTTMEAAMVEAFADTAPGKLNAVPKKPVRRTPHGTPKLASLH
jgi:predicted PurR-regulated permease PerM